MDTQPDVSTREKQNMTGVGDIDTLSNDLKNIIIIDILFLNYILVQIVIFCSNVYIFL